MAVVKIRIADEEPFVSFTAGVAAAWRHFARVDTAALGDQTGAVLAGITELRRALAELTGETPPRPLPEDEPLRGAVILEWPAPPQHGAGCVLGNLVAVYDALTGEHPGPRPVTTVTRMVLRVDMDAYVTADLTMFAGADGEPVTDGQPVMKDGRILTGTFRYLVAAMRTACNPEPPGPPVPA